MDNICNTFGSLAAGFGFIIHNGGLYTHTSGYRRSDTDNPAAPGSKSSVIKKMNDQVQKGNL